MRTTTAMLALAVSAGLASAQFTVLIPGPIASDGATVNDTYAGANAIFTTMDFAGDLTEINTGTFASEADWNISVNGGAALEFDPTTLGGFTGTTAVATTLSGLFWANTGDNFQFDTFESFDDGGDAIADAEWTNTSFAFSGAFAGATDLGTFGTALTIDTVGSDYDTELALYTIDGTLIANNDDIGGGVLQSEILASLTIDTTYLIVVGGFNSQFGDWLATAGSASGNALLNINGNNVAGAASNSGEFLIYSFTIPAPGSAALLGLGGLAAIRRRR